MSPTYGALFAGMGGLELGVQSVLGGHTLWHSEFDTAASKVLAHHWPDVPNLGDITEIDWATTPRVNVLTGGSPCQDVSSAGARRGMKPGTRSGLWASMSDAIQILKPDLVVWENVRGALSAEAHSDLEPCPGCVGDERGGLFCEHLDVYSETWPTSGMTRGGVAYELPMSEPLTAGIESSCSPGLPTQRATRGGSSTETVALLPTPMTTDGGSASIADTQRNSPGLRVVGHLLPTPRATDGTKGGPNQRGSSGDLMLPSAVHHLLPTPTASTHESNRSLSPGAAIRPTIHGVTQLFPTPSVADGTGGHATRSGTRSGELLLPGIVRLLPTPTSVDSTSSGGAKPSFVTLTDATVRTDMGRIATPRHWAHTHQPSPAGNPSWGVQRQRRQSQHREAGDD